MIPEGVDLDQYFRARADELTYNIGTGGEWKDQTKKLLDEGDKLHGCILPWAKLQNVLRCRFGELTLVAGPDGHRKSLLVGQLMGWFTNKYTVAIGSYEMKPEETLSRMCRQMVGVSKPSEDKFNQFIARAEWKMYIHDELDMISEERCLAFVHWSAVEGGARFIVIDSLTKLAFPSSDKGDREQKFINRLQNLAKTLDVHIFLICHTRKQGERERGYRKDDIRGSSQLTNVADNVWITTANMSKIYAQQKQAQGMDLDEKETDSLNKPCQLIEVVKQRHAQFHGKITLWLDLASGQFKSQQTTPVRDYFEKVSE